MNYAQHAPFDQERDTGEGFDAVFAQERSKEFSRIDIVDGPGLFGRGDAAGKTGPQRDVDVTVDFHAFGGPGHKLVVVFQQQDRDGVDVHRFANTLEQFGKQLFDRQMGEGHLGDGLHAPHPFDSCFCFEARALFAFIQLNARGLGTVAVDELPELVADAGHDFQQAGLRLLRLARKELHHAADFVSELDGNSKSTVQTGL